MTTELKPERALQLVRDCDRYLNARTATFAQRCQRYRSATHIMEHTGKGLSDEDIILDFGAGGTDLDAYLRRSHLWRGRYWPVDGWMGYDLQWWKPKRQVAWVIALEVIEHLPQTIAMQILAEFKTWCTKGVILSTPNPDTVDVLAMDDTHLWSCWQHDLYRAGYTTEISSLYGRQNDSILAWWLT